MVYLTKNLQEKESRFSCVIDAVKEIKQKQVMRRWISLKQIKMGGLTNGSGVEKIYNINESRFSYIIKPVKETKQKQVMRRSIKPKEAFNWHSSIRWLKVSWKEINNATGYPTTSKDIILDLISTDSTQTILSNFFFLSSFL